MNTHLPDFTSYFHAYQRTRVLILQGMIRAILEMSEFFMANSRVLADFNSHMSGHIGSYQLSPTSNSECPRIG